MSDAKVHDALRLVLGLDTEGEIRRRGTTFETITAALREAREAGLVTKGRGGLQLTESGRARFAASRATTAMFIAPANGERVEQLGPDVVYLPRPKDSFFDR